MDRTESTVHLQSTSQAKIALFRSLFRGRDDVTPRRFESRKTGKSGYAPACANEWIRGICEKPRVKCADCSHRRFLVVTDDVIRWHLSGHDDAGQPFVAGVYPMLRDEACFFLAVDFDKTGWREDATAFVETCRQLNLPAAVAYRRDRRKDQLLQENGYWVLRFLAEDVGKELDAVLDAILRSLAHRQRQLS